MKMHWFKWEKLCLPKSLGGLNFRAIEGFNQAFIAKQVWRILADPMSLASRFFKSIYFMNGNILEAKLGRKPSCLWKSLLWGRDLLKQGIRYRVGNGEFVFMFKDPWIPKELTFKPICVNRNVFREKVYFFMTSTRDWNLDLLKNSMVGEDFDIIRGIPINLNANDRCAI